MADTACPWVADTECPWVADTARPFRPRLPSGVIRSADCLLFICVTLVIVSDRAVVSQWPPEAVALRVTDTARRDYVCKLNSLC